MVPNAEAALHLCVLLASVPGRAVTAGDLAEFHALSPDATAKLFQRLASSGVVEARAGRGGGYLLARSAAEITVADIVGAVGGSAPHFSCQEIRRRGPCAPTVYSTRCAIARLMDEAQAAWWSVLGQMTLESLAKGIAAQIDPVTSRESAIWLRERARPA